ncbi:hypothetical protein BDV59DRAFT_191568 [Aspergillus ambiguus]|uniref:oxygenase MpaB family protein n=1 Tax=Aspergillus ambiguus TaxID=176160 RepID=UPI003CCE3638
MRYPDYFRDCELKKVAREGIALAGGPAAILLQIAHPKVGQGVADHSTFTTRAISRAQYTQMYIYVMIFGNEDEKAAMRAWVDKAHSRVKGGEKDKAYDAMDPGLQLWVAATIYASMVSMYELIYGPLPPAMAERVYQAYSIMGTSLQVPREMWPANLRAFRVYWKDMVQNHLDVSVDARMVLKDLWHPKGIPFWIKPAVWFAMPFVRRITAEQLPPAIREQFALRSTKSSRAITGLFISGMSGVYPLTPRFIRTLPKTYSMRLVRKRMNKRGGQLVKD